MVEQRYGDNGKDIKDPVPYSKSLEKHLESLDPVQLIMWALGDAFSMYASSLGIGGKVELGVTGKGEYAVRWKSGKKIQTFKYPKDAVAHYKGILIGEIPED